jgi:hypothetical protein
MRKQLLISNLNPTSSNARQRPIISEDDRISLIHVNSWFSFAGDPGGRAVANAFEHWQRVFERLYLLRSWRTAQPMRANPRRAVPWTKS